VSGSNSILLPSGGVAPLMGQAGYVYPVAVHNVPGTIAASGTFTTGPLPAAGMKHLAGSAELTTTGSLVVQRFLDTGTIVSVGSTSVAMTGGTIALFDINDGKVFQSYDISVINTGTVAGTLTNVNIVQSSV
jgi:hypothetical protein